MRAGDAEDLAEARQLNAQVLRLYGEGRYQEALPPAQRVLAIREKALGPEHPETATSLNNLAELYRTLGAYAKAEPLYLRALAIKERERGPAHADTARGLNNLAELYRSMSAYAKAEPLLVRALAILERALGPEHPDTATIVNNLAGLYQSMGAYAKAEPLFVRALAIDEKVLGPEHPDTASSLDNLASLYRAMGADAKAEPLQVRAVAIRNKALGPEHPVTAKSLGNLAELYESMGDFAKAEPLLARALAIKERALGPEHPDTARSLNNLAALYDSMGAYAKAEPLYLRALSVAGRGEQPEILWTVTGNLMDLYAPEQPTSNWTPDPSLAIWYGKLAVNTLQSVRGQMKPLSAENQQSFLRSKEGYYTRLAALLIDAGRIPEAEQVLAMLKEHELAQLVRRSEAQKTQADYVGAAERQAIKDNEALLARGVKDSAELAALERRRKFGETLGPADEARRQALLKAAEQWRTEYQRWLAGLKTQFARAQGQPVDVALQGKFGEALQTRVRADPGAVGLHYVVTDERIAIIVATPGGSFGRVSVVKRSDLNRQIGAWRQALQSRADTRPAAQALYRILIAPVAKDLADANAQTLVLSLTDTLRYLPFAALQDEQGRYLVETHALSVYTSAGGTQPQASRTKWQVAGLGVTKARSDVAALPGVRFAALPAVKVELQAIVKGPDSPRGVLPGQITLDEQFDRARLENALLPPYNVVHVASHFNFSPGDESRSLLVLGKGELSLGQLAVMDFANVEQLTLSACDTATGGGANANGAEVEGLAAAVQQRGAQAVLASLWPVADESTAQLMHSFYAAMGGANRPTRAKALQQAQLQMLRGGTVAPSGTLQGSGQTGGVAQAQLAPAPATQARPYAHPYFWAPFVLMGNWL